MADAPHGQQVCCCEIIEADGQKAWCCCTTEVKFYDTASRFGYTAQSKLFRGIGIGVTAFFLMWVAVDTDYNHSITLWTSSWIFIVVDSAVLVFFLSEVFVRVMAFRDKRQICSCGALIWDIVLVALLILTICLGVLAGIFGGLQLSRMARFFKMVQLSRMARLFKMVPLWSRPKEGTTLPALILQVSVSFALFFLCLLYVIAIGMRQISADTDVGEEYFPNVAETMMNIMLHGGEWSRPKEDTTLPALAAAEMAQILFLYIIFIIGLLVAAGLSIAVIVLKIRAKKSELGPAVVTIGNARKAQDGASEDVQIL